MWSRAALLGWMGGREGSPCPPPHPSLSPGGCRDSCREQHPDSTPPLPTLFLRLLRGMKNNPRAHRFHVYIS